jgi:hypothetical protein
MPERSAITQGVQLGVESTPGTNVAANKKLNSVGFIPGVAVDMQRFRAFGNKFATIETPGKEFTEFDLEGVGDYSELIYLFASAIVSPSAPTVSDTTAQTWTFTPATAAEDTVKTYTIESGGTVRAMKFNYGLINAVELTLNRDGVQISGGGFGQRLSDGITMTAGPTSLAQVPILPTDIDVWLDTTSGGLGTTKLTRVTEVTVTLGDRYAPVWVLNSANNSFVAHVETEPTAQIALTLEADSAGMAWLTDMRAGSTKFLRVKGTSPTLAGAATVFYSWTWDAAVKVAEVGDFDEEDGLYVVDITYDMVHDGTWGKAFTTSVVNKIATL